MLRIILTILVLTSLIFSAPKRVVSLGPIVTKQLYLLGLTDEVVGNSQYCIEPKGVKKAVKVGSVIKSNIETIVTLEPEIVFATGLSDPSQIEKLKNLGIRVETIITPKSYKEMKEVFLQVAKLIDKTDYAKKIIEESDKELKKIKFNENNRKEIFFQIGKDPIFTVIKESFMNDIIGFAGGKNIAISGNGIYSREKVVEQNPEFIVITTMGGVGKDEVKVWKKFSEMKAVKRNHISIVDQDLFCSPTVKTFPKAVKELNTILFK